MNALLIQSVSTRRFESRTAKGAALGLAILADDRYSASVTVTEVARVTGVTRATALRGIDDLIEQGIIERVHSEPETTRQVRLTLKFNALALTNLPSCFPAKATNPHRQLQSNRS